MSEPSVNFSMSQSGDRSQPGLSCLPLAAFQLDFTFSFPLRLLLVSQRPPMSRCEDVMPGGRCDTNLLCSQRQRRAPQEPLSPQRWPVVQTLYRACFHSPASLHDSCAWHILAGWSQTWGLYLYSFILTLSIWLFLQRLLCLERVMIQFQYQSNANDAVIYLIYSNSAYMACWRQAQHQNEKVKPFRCSNNTWSTQICFDLSCCITMRDMISGCALK